MRVYLRISVIAAWGIFRGSKGQFHYNKQWTRSSRAEMKEITKPESINQKWKCYARPKADEHRRVKRCAMQDFLRNSLFVIKEIGPQVSGVDSRVWGWGSVMRRHSMSHCFFKIRNYWPIIVQGKLWHHHHYSLQRSGYAKDLYRVLQRWVWVNLHRGMIDRRAKLKNSNSLKT